MFKIIILLRLAFATFVRCSGGFASACVLISWFVLGNDCGAPFGHPFDDGEQEIVVERKLRNSVEGGDGERDGGVDEEGHVLEAMVEEKEVAGAEGDEHGDDGEEERGEADEQLPGQVGSEVLVVEARGQDPEERDHGGRREAQRHQRRECEDDEPQLVL